MDKALSKHALREAGVPTPDWFAFNETAFRELGAADALGLLEAEVGAVTEAALGAYRALGCGGFARADLVLGEDGQVLEVNAIPGLTDTSLLPQAAEAAGVSFEDLVERILQLALESSGAATPRL